MSESEDLKNIVKCLIELVKAQQQNNEILTKYLQGISDKLSEIKEELEAGIATSVYPGRPY